MAKVCYKAWVQGTVQGVGFRYSTQAKANTLNVQGYARNLEDGRGSPGLRRCRTGQCIT